MGARLSHTAEIQEEVIRALLVNGPAVMDIAKQLDLTSREVRDILRETLSQFGESVPRTKDVIPIAPHVPTEIPQLDATGICKLMTRGCSYR